MSPFFVAKKGVTFMSGYSNCTFLLLISKFDNRTCYSKLWLFERLEITPRSFRMISTEDYDVHTSICSCVGFLSSDQIVSASGTDQIRTEVSR